MNGGNTPGYLLAQIESALCSAFPSDDDLARMLRYQFNINLNKLVIGGNLNQIVYNLLLDFDNKKKLGNLINGALKENSDNPDLKAIQIKFKITTCLLKILLPLEKKFINQMQQAYQACCPDEFLDDWEDELPDTLFEILGNLDDIPQANEDEEIIVKFVARLLATGDIPDQTADKLKQWIKKNPNNPSDLLPKTSSHSKNDQQPNLEAQPYLLVKLESSKQYHQQRQSYLVEAWFIADISNYDYLRNYQNCNPLKTPPNDEKYEQYIFSIEDLPKLIIFFIKQSKLILKKEFTNFYLQGIIKRFHKPIIVFYLPYQLFNYAFERIETEDDDNSPIPIGSEYCVIFRSVKRLGKNYYQGQWLIKWKQLQNNNTTISCLNNFAFSDCETWEELYADWEEKNAIGVKLHKPPCEQILGMIDRTAIPVVLWLRKNDFKTINFKQALEQLLNCQINELPEKVKQQRLQAFPKAKKKQEHIGHHLALLWEDPYLLPPQSDCNTP
ncbi:effector-associated domain EAD1-containing protein [Moorena producens]|uniref:VMAP-C domain-containing protein n=1 Tax=Moorena producens TaxID=1155739 RepID=UPI003C76D2BE